MRSKIDARNERVRKGTRKPLQGGKALQRLFAYLAARDPQMIGEVVDTVRVPAAARPKVGLAARAMAAPAARTAPLRKAAAPAAARTFARGIARAAEKVRASQPRARRVRRARRALAAPAVSPAAWTPIGPSNIPNGQTYGSNTVDVIGRVGGIAVDPGNVQHVLVGSAGGGIWETKDGGATWAPRSDALPSLAIGALTFDPNDATRAYAGSGEGNFYATLGAGVYRSTDGGTTWKVLAAAPFVGIGFYDLVVDPSTSATLYAATTNGFYVSTNGGTSWSRKRAVKCWDITVHPSGGGVELLVAFADGLFASTNSGSAFSSVALPSTPAAAWDRLAVDRVAAAPDVAYAFGSAGGKPHLWRRSGTTWTKVAPLPAMNVTQAWYDWYVAASPTDRGQVFLGAIDTFRGKLSGNAFTWKNITTQGSKSIHPDQHCLTFAPHNSSMIFAGNDGGVYRSGNSGASWTALNKGLGITEVEYLASDPNTWQWIMAGTQDNGTIRYTGNSAWDHIADGDGGDCGVNQLNPNRVYHSFYFVSLERSNNKGNTWTDVAPPATPSLFYPPVEVSGDTVGIGGVALVITRTGGPPWTTVSLGLPSGDGASAMRALDANTFLVGTTQGRVRRAAWNGATWTITSLTSPAARFISCIAVDPSNPSRIWVTLSQLGGGRVFRSDDGGVTWIDRTGGLPPIPMNSVVVDPADYQRVWVSADVGVYQTSDLGATWTNFSAGLPNAVAADLLFHKQDRMLVCGTRNRGVWVIKV